MTVARHLGPDGKIVAPNIGRAGPVPVIKPLPDIAAMHAMDDGDLWAFLVEMGVVDGRAFAAGAEQIANRLMRVPPGTGDFDSLLDRMMESEGHRALVGMARRAKERWQTLEALDGDIAAELVRISEGDDHVCENCEALAGATGTLADHEAIGAPGAASCLGGDYCRCQIVRID